MIAEKVRHDIDDHPINVFCNILMDASNATFKAMMYTIFIKNCNYPKDICILWN